MFAEGLNVTCVILQDVDLFPEDDRLSYGCPNLGEAMHMGAYVDTLNYRLVLADYFLSLTVYLRYS